MLLNITLYKWKLKLLEKVVLSRTQELEETLIFECRSYNKTGNVVDISRFNLDPAAVEYSPRPYTPTKSPFGF